MTAPIDITNMIFGRLCAIKRIGSKNGKPIWLCKCSCGNTITTLGESLRSGNTKSCGCLQKDTAANIFTKHGLSKTRTYNIWNGIVTRCTNKKHHSYALYGALGLSICDRWLSFENFFNDMGECPNNHSIDRININEGYNPSNCRWASNFVQSRNKRTNVLLTFCGKTMCQTDWANAIGIKRETIARRIKLGWTVEKILTTKVRK